MIRIILGRKDLRIVTVNAQKEEGQLFARRGRFDVLAADEEGRYYEIEVQNTKVLLSTSGLLSSQAVRRLQEAARVLCDHNNGEQ